MIRFVQRYLQYRRVGIRRIAALHYAWLVTTGGRAIQLLGR